MSEEKKTETSKDVVDFLIESYSKAVETATKLQQQYFENVKKATEYLLSLQKTWIDAIGRLTAVSPDILGKGLTAEAYRSLYDFWVKQFEMLSRLMGVPITAPLMEFIEPAREVAEIFWKGIDIYSRIYAVWTELARKSIEVVSENLTELQKATLGAYKGWISLLSVPEEEREKIFNWFTESIKKSLEATTSAINKQLETLAKLLEDLSVNIEKLTTAMKTGVATKS